MKYLLNSKEWEEIRRLINDTKSFVDTAYVEAYNAQDHSVMQCKASMKRILAFIEEAQKTIQKLDNIT
jgi:hypothetical protein